MKRVGKLENIAQYQIIAGVNLRAYSNLAKLVMLLRVSNFAFGLLGKYRVVLFLD
jgi:hypothetical protein